MEGKVDYSSAASFLPRQRRGVRWQRGKAQAFCPDDTAVESRLNIRTPDSYRQRRRRCREAPASLPPHSTTLTRIAERQGKEKRWDEEGHGFYLAWLRLSLNKPTTTNPTPRDVKTGWTLFGPLMAVIKVPDPMPNMRAPHVDVVKKNRLLITFPLSSARG